MVVGILYFMGPPNSPPIFLLKTKTATQITASIQYTVTDIANVPGGTSNSVPLMAWYTDAMVQAKPIPKNTLTALLPVTFPIDESAYLSPTAAVLLAKVSVNK